MTVYDNITFMAEPSEHLNQLMKTLNISHLKTISNDIIRWRSSACCWHALSTKPDLILLDEPFSSLDDATRDEGIELIKRIFQEWQIPIIFVTHSNYEAETLADELIIIG